MTNPRPFRSGFGRGNDWAEAVKACLAALDGPEKAGDETLGFVYVTEPLSDDLSSVLTFLRQKTGIEHWVGAVGIGIFGVDTTEIGEAAITVLLGRFPTDTFEVFADPRDLWRKTRFKNGAALVHGNPRDRAMEQALTGFVKKTGCAPYGGLTVVNKGRQQIADAPLEALFSGVAFRPSVALATGTAQGCLPIGEPHRLTGFTDNIALGLDDRPALDVLKEDVGEILARDIRRAAGFIHAALCDGSPDETDEPCEAHYRVRALLGVDNEREAVVLGAELGDVKGLRFVKRDPNQARHALDLMLTRAADGLGAKMPVGGVYISCAARAGAMFEPEGELSFIRRHLPGVPVIGFYANGEIADADVHTQTGVLVLFGDADA